MEAVELRDLWEDVHGVLSERHRQSFLERGEVELLLGMPRAAVLSAISRSPKLIEIAEIARREAWWYEGEPCPEDDLAWCARCKPHPYPSVVVITRGWSAAFHREETCEALQRGQERVTKRGGEPAPLERVAVQEALGAGRFACLICLPPARSS